MRLSYGWSWQAVSFLFAVSECWRVKSHKGTIFCVIRDCPVINGRHTAIGDSTNQSPEGGIDMHLSPWQRWSRERAKRTYTLQLLLKANHYLVMEEEEAVGSATAFEPFVGEMTSRRLCVEGAFHDANPTLQRWSNNWGIELRTSGSFAWLEEMVYQRWQGFWAVLLESS